MYFRLKWKVNLSLSTANTLTHTFSHIHTHIYTHTHTYMYTNILTHTPIGIILQKSVGLGRTPEYDLFAFNLQFLWINKCAVCGPTLYALLTRWCQHFMSNQIDSLIFLWRMLIQILYWLKLELISFYHGTNKITFALFGDHSNHSFHRLHSHQIQH